MTRLMSPANTRSDHAIEAEADVAEGIGQHLEEKLGCDRASTGCAKAKGCNIPSGKSNGLRT